MLHSPVPQLAKTKLSTAEKLYDSAICPAGGHKCLTFVLLSVNSILGACRLGGVDASCILLIILLLQ